MTVIWSNPLPPQPTAANCIPQSLIIYHSTSASVACLFEPELWLREKRGRQRIKAKGQKKLTANHNEPISRLCSFGSSSITLVDQRPHSRLISLLCTFTTSIHQMTNSGAINECSLNCQQLRLLLLLLLCVLHNTHTSLFLPEIGMNVLYLHSAELHRLHVQTEWDSERRERKHLCHTEQQYM